MLISLVTCSSSWLHAYPPSCMLISLLRWSGGDSVCQVLREETMSQDRALSPALRTTATNCRAAAVVVHSRGPSRCVHVVWCPGGCLQTAVVSTWVTFHPTYMTHFYAVSDSAVSYSQSPFVLLPLSLNSQSSPAFSVWSAALLTVGCAALCESIGALLDGHHLQRPDRAAHLMVSPVMPNILPLLSIFHAALCVRCLACYGTLLLHIARLLCCVTH